MFWVKIGKGEGEGELRVWDEELRYPKCVKPQIGGEMGFWERSFGAESELKLR